MSPLITVFLWKLDTVDIYLWVVMGVYDTLSVLTILPKICLPARSLNASMLTCHPPCL